MGRRGQENTAGVTRGMEKTKGGDILSEPIRVKGVGHDECFNRIPYASLMATLMCFMGVVLFSVMVTWGFNATAEQTRPNFLHSIGCYYVTFCLLFLAVGFTATGATREEMYKGTFSMTKAELYIYIYIYYFTNCIVLLYNVVQPILMSRGFQLFCWLFIMAVCSILCFVYFTFDDLCYSMTAFTEADCIDLGVFITLFKSFNSDLRICGGDAQQFCALSSTARSWYIVGWIGSCIVLLGLTMFIAIHAANYAHVGNANRYVELRDLAMEGIPTPPSIPSQRLKYGDERNLRYAHEMARKEENSWNRGSRYGVSSSRLADQMSDSVSQYAYGRKLSGRSSVSTVSLGNVLERCAAALEELRTLNELIGSEADEVKKGLRSIDTQLKMIDNIWENIDNTVRFVAQQQSDIGELYIYIYIYIYIYNMGV
uniref:MARVEL domain-containing protein n=1 Tax=Heterorhabditis bacteriophora TaxID=37862 RepID=A0A1I7XBN6_HETBA